ncbi:MAG: DNA repair protein RadC [candidate division WOR-3 bacterium]|nr:DNA repair protein RadC [candidate division WOR-3 bacterium]
MKTNYPKTVKDLPKVERPREKLIKYGVEKLSNTELLAIILRSGKKGENVIDLAHRILKHFGAQNLPNLSFDEVKNISGIGPAKACEIIACFELGKRLLQGKKSCLYLKPEDVWNELKDLRGLKKEHFVVFYLDVRNQEIKREIISIGSLNASLVHPREVFEPAIRNAAAQIILAHNHPSDNPEPSDDDLAITKRLVEAGKILGIEVLDHIIVAKSRFYSLKENGLI